RCINPTTHTLLRYLKTEAGSRTHCRDGHTHALQVNCCFSRSSRQAAESLARLGAQRASRCSAGQCSQRAKRRDRAESSSGSRAGNQHHPRDRSGSIAWVCASPKRTLESLSHRRIELYDYLLRRSLRKPEPVPVRSVNSRGPRFIECYQSSAGVE